jgi:hypothetical protein
MRNIFFHCCFVLLGSCAEKKEPAVGFYDKALDFVLDNPSGEIVEFPELYDSLTSTIPDDAAEKPKLVEKLKVKGFKVTNWGRGNHPLGPRIIVINMKKDDCECEIAKTHYSTANDSLYQMSEKISCKKVKG